jgi:peptidoglycan/LPS O-acetylase OafA/YrhL
MGGFTPGHLWFVLFLFLIASITLPLLFYLRRERGKRLIGRLADFVLDHPSSLWLFALPLVVAWGLPDIGGKNLIYYLVLFVYGYILMTDVRFEKALARIKASALILGSILLISLLIVWTMGREWPEWAQLIMGILYSGPLTWSLLMAILGFGKKCQSFNHPVLRYASEAAYPFYILHQTVIVLIGYYVVQWHLSILLKFLIINATALIATVSVYEMLIRRVNVSRFLFGLKPRRKPKRFLPHAVKREAGRQ